MGFIEEILSEEIIKFRDWLSNPYIPCILVGPTGSGKTFTIHHVCSNLGYSVVEVEYEDLDISKMRRILTSKPILPTVYVIDNVEEDRNLHTLISETKNPLVFTSTKRVDSLERVCNVIIFKKPRTAKVVKLIRNEASKLGVDVKFDSITSDLRQAAMLIYGSMGYDAHKSVSRRVENYLKTGNIDSLEVQFIPILLRSATSNFQGKDLYFFIKALEIADKSKKIHPLKGFVGRGVVEW